MRKVVINTCYGGFSVSNAVLAELGLPDDASPFYPFAGEGVTREAERVDPRLIAAIEKVGVENAGGKYAELEIVEIPDDAHFLIFEVDGCEDVIWSLSEIHIN